MNPTQLTQLRAVLAELYPRENDQRRIVGEAGLRQAAIAFDPSADNAWFNILTYARNQGKLAALLDLVMKENPDNELLQRAGEEQPPALLRGADIKTAVSWHGPTANRQLQEKILGAASALVPVSYLAKGLRCARSVARIVLADGSVGTGFLTSNDVLITNHHVLPDAAAAARAKAQFNYQQTMDGLDEPMEEVAPDPKSFFLTSPEDDFTAVRLAGRPTQRWGALLLEPAEIAVGDRVNIIQHPAGGYKQLSFFSNAVVFVGGNRVQYWTDTLPGSSGAPVLDRHWRVVAVHHSGGWLPEPGNPGRTTFFRNEGILIDVVRKALAESERPAQGGGAGAEGARGG